jgi:pyruvate,water dikinase
VIPFVLGLGDARARDPALVGPKAAHLSRLKATCPVPDGFCLTAEAYRHSHAAGGMSDEVGAAVRVAYAALVGADPNPPPVAVRSSAIDEDGPTASFAGQHETVLDVVGLDAVLASIERSWRSLHAPAALAYRRSQGLPVEGIALAVLVQKLVRADRSGVAFSIDPVSRRADRIVVNAAWGLGESMVNGTVTPDAWQLDKASLEVTSERLAEKERMTVAAVGGTREVPVPGFLRGVATLDGAMRTEVAALARRLEEELGWPVDIEFAFDDDRLHLLQCRPVTTALVDATSEASDASLPAPWTEPDDAAKFWELDRVHFPEQIPMLDYAYGRMIYDVGLNHGMAHYRVPFASTARRFWTYFYATDVPYDRGEVKPEERSAAMAAFADGLEAAWEDRWRPAIRDALDAWAAFDLDGAPYAAFLRHVDETWERAEALWRLHFEIVVPLGRVVREFVELYDELFEPDEPFAAHELLGGAETLTMIASRRVWALRDVVDRTPGAAEVVASTDPSRLLERLDRDEATRPVADAVRGFLEAFGRRTPTIALSAPTLAEDPTPVMKILKEAVARPDADPARDHAEILARRDAATEEARATLRSYPRPVRDEFERRLKGARIAMRLGEDHNYLIDFSATAAVRRVFVALARRLASAGVIADVGDVAHLTPGEARDAFARLGDADLRGLVNGRKEELRRFASITPPETIGERPGGVSPKPSAEALRRRVARDGLLTGTAGSPGVARGRARVIRTLADTERFVAGEVLVAPTTSQPWMPLFGAAAALVTEAGGTLSHAAVVAREFRLPAVVAVASATDLIRDGQLVEVDGDRGLVRLLEGP